VISRPNLAELVCWGDNTVHWPGRLAELVEDWVYLIQRDGWRSALPEVGRAILTLPYRRIEFTVLARSLLEPLPDLQSGIALEIRELGAADLNLVRQINRPSEAKAFARRLAHGHVGFLALHEGQPVGYAWACTEIAPTIERVNLKLGPGDVLCTDAYTVSAYRGQGVQTVLTLARLKLFRHLGYRRALTTIEMRNHPSLAAWQKVGAQAIGRMTFLRIGLWRRTHYRLEGIG
jgi:GNAT superfamily N-acetyltransferase